MKIAFSAVIAAFLLPFISCTKPLPVDDDVNSYCFQGRLEKRGICGQLVVRIMSVNKDGLRYEAGWTDSSTGLVYENVFAVSNSCEFPASIQEGDLFNFYRVSSPGILTCVVCQAFTPVPGEHMGIRLGCFDPKD